MASSQKKSKSRKVVYKKAEPKQPVKENKTLSFLIGFVVVMIIGFLLFTYSQNRNYKQVHGAQIEASEQSLGK